MTVREAALEAIRLAERRNAEEHGIDEQLGLAVGYEWGADKALKSRLASRPAERALIDYLGSLPPDVLFNRGTHALISARAVLTLAANGDDGAIFTHIDAFADNATLLGSFLRALSSAAEESVSRADTARRGQGLLRESSS